MPTESLRIKRMGVSGHSFLNLEGTVLICRHKNRVSESKLLIPIESIEISENNTRFYKDLLTVALVIILLPLGILTFECLRGKINPNEVKKDLFPIIGVIALLEFWMLFALVFNFLFTKKTVCLTIANTPIKIEFWKKRKNTKRIDLLLAQIQQKQLQIGHYDNTESQHVQTVETRHVNPLGRFVCLCFLFSIPALILEKPILLSLCLIPIVRFIQSSFNLRKQPKQFRQAVKNIQRKKWNDAIELLKHLHEHLPEYIPAIYLLIDTYIYAERFDEALSFVDTVPEKYFKDSNAVRLYLWKWKRINSRRVEPD
jgi:hypothetical protein